jgi:hypothetical protein
MSTTVAARPGLWSRDRATSARSRTARELDAQALDGAARPALVDDVDRAVDRGGHRDRIRELARDPERCAACIAGGEHEVAVEMA